MIEYPVVNRQMTAVLDHRVYAMGERIVKFDKLANRDPKTRIFDIMKNFTRMLEDFNIGLAKKFYANGGGAGSTDLHGLLTACQYTGTAGYVGTNSGSYAATDILIIYASNGTTVIGRGSFADYAGRAVEPIIRSGIERRIAGGDPRFGGARIVGGFWTRDNQVEVDLVGADRESPPVKSVDFVGSIKWRVARPLDGHDVADLERATSRIVGATPGTTVVGVSRTGFAGISRRIVEVSPEEILEAFPAD
jgi:hypothetical protein